MKHSLNDNQIEEVARLFAALAEPTRLRLLRELRSGAKSVMELVQVLGLGQANVSKQLGVLFQAGLVTRTREGVQVYYSLRQSLAMKLCAMVCDHIKGEVVERAKAFNNSK